MLPQLPSMPLRRRRDGLQRLHLQLILDADLPHILLRSALSTQPLSVVKWLNSASLNIKHQRFLTNCRRSVTDLRQCGSFFDRQYLPSYDHLCIFAVAGADAPAPAPSAAVPKSVRPAKKSTVSAAAATFLAMDPETSTTRTEIKKGVSLLSTAGIQSTIHPVTGQVRIGMTAAQFRLFQEHKDTFVAPPSFNATFEIFPSSSSSSSTASTSSSSSSTSAASSSS